MLHEVVSVKSTPQAQASLSKRDGSTFGTSNISSNSSVQRGHPTVTTEETVDETSIQLQCYYCPCCFTFNQGSQVDDLHNHYCYHHLNHYHHYNHFSNALPMSSYRACTIIASPPSSYSPYPELKDTPSSFLSPCSNKAIHTERNYHPHIPSNSTLNRPIDCDHVTKIHYDEKPFTNKSQLQDLQHEYVPEGNDNACNYRDFSHVPPSPQDYEMYRKKKLYQLLSQQEEEGQHQLRRDDDKLTKILMKRGRGNKVLRPDTAPLKRFVGCMGTNFPARLHDLLSLIQNDSTLSSAISWLPHGRSWIVNDKKEFLEKVSPSHFHFSKYESFLRQVNGWGFKRVTSGPDENSYYHELFLRDMPHLIQWMKRSTKTRGPDHNTEKPLDFHIISAKYPIPNYYISRDIDDYNKKSINDNAWTSGFDNFQSDMNPLKNEDEPTKDTKTETASAEVPPLKRRKHSDSCPKSSNPPNLQTHESCSIVSNSPLSHLSNDDVIQVQNMWMHGTGNNNCSLPIDIPFVHDMNFDDLIQDDTLISCIDTFASIDHQNFKAAV
jgi:hypothetical protein